MKISYDSKADVLYVMLEETSDECDYIEPTPGAVLRVNPKTGRIVGCTVLFFKKRLQRGEQITVPEIAGVPIPRGLKRLIA
jgi:uncharacterized protein YuzE